MIDKFVSSSQGKENIFFMSFRVALSSCYAVNMLLPLIAERRHSKKGSFGINNVN